MSQSILEDDEAVYDIVDIGTSRGCKKLVSSHGYSYTMKVTNYLFFTKIHHFDERTTKALIRLCRCAG